MNAPVHDFAEPADVTKQIATLRADGYELEARRSFGVLSGLLRDLLLDDRGRLGLMNSRNHARLVRAGDDRLLVLKLTTVLPGDETGALRLWGASPAAARLVPRLYAWGSTDEGFQWSLQEHLLGVSRAVADGLGLIPDVFDLAAELHLANETMPSALEAVDRRLFAAMGSEHRVVARVASQLRQRLHAVSAWGPNVLLHGDFGANNILDDVGRLRAIDPAGFCGPACYDAARFLARSTSRVPVAPRVTELAEHIGASLDVFALLTACELLDVAAWAVRHDITARGVSALLTDVEATAALPFRSALVPCPETFARVAYAARGVAGRPHR